MDCPPGEDGSDLPSSRRCRAVCGGADRNRRRIEIGGVVRHHVEKHRRRRARIQIDALEVPACIDGRVDQFLEIDRLEMHYIARAIA